MEGFWRCRKLHSFDLNIGTAGGGSPLTKMGWGKDTPVWFPGRPSIPGVATKDGLVGRHRRRTPQTCPPRRASAAVLWRGQAPVPPPAVTSRATDSAVTEVAHMAVGSGGNGGPRGNDACSNVQECSARAAQRCQEGSNSPPAEGAKTTRTLGGQDEVRGGGALRQGAGQAEADDGGQQQRQRLSLAASGAGAHSQLTLRFKIPERKDVQPNQNRFGIAMVL